MESADLFTLTEEHWKAIEKISDLLAEPADLPVALTLGPDAAALNTQATASANDLAQALQQSLELLLNTLGRASGAFFLPRFCEHIAQDWTLISPPDEWETQDLSGRSLLEALAEQAMLTGQVQPGNEDLQIGAVFPIRSTRKALGALLVCGPEIPVEAYPLWQAFLRPVARTVSMHAQVSGNVDGTPNYLELMRSRNTLRAMFDSLPISIYIIDSTYQLVAINFSRADRVGEKPSRLVGLKCYEGLYQRNSPCPGCLIGETFSAAQNTIRVSRNWLDGDKFVEWEINTFPIEEKDQVTQAIVIEQDVTEKRNLESNLIQSEKLAAVGQLAAGVVHEINNPLTAIIANAQLLSREVPPENKDLLDSVKLIEMAGTRASQVVRNLLGIARKERYEFEPIDLNETLNNALSLVQHELVGRPIQVELDLASSLPRVLASQDQMQGVWINLILNAIDAIDKEPGLISVATRYNGREFQVSIMDNGKGISEENQMRIFDPFFTTKSPGRGTGLGLSVCMRVVRHHGGTILVESQQGEWTRFTVVLPGPK